MKKVVDTKFFRFLSLYYLYFTLMVGLLGTLVSLYFSEFMELPPCDLCWYQRVLFYPIPVIALIGILFKDNKAYRYILAFALSGAPIALYHHLLKVTNLFPKDTPFCGSLGACSEVEWEMIQGLGITIPFLAFMGFAVIVALGIIRAVSSPSTSSLSGGSSDVTRTDSVEPGLVKQ